MFDQFAQLLLVDVERRRHFADALHQFREVVGLGSGGRLEDHRVAAQGLFAAPVGLVEGLRGVDAADFGILFCAIEAKTWLLAASADIADWLAASALNAAALADIAANAAGCDA